LLQGIDNGLDRNASDHQIGILGPYENIIRSFVDCTTTDRRFKLASGSANADDMFGQPLAMQSQSDRSSQESHSDDAYAL
jgi:hypothetical protein